MSVFGGLPPALAGLATAALLYLSGALSCACRYALRAPSAQAFRHGCHRLRCTLGVRRMAARLVVLGFPWLALGYSSRRPVRWPVTLRSSAFMASRSLRCWSALPLPSCYAAGLPLPVPAVRALPAVPGRCYLPSRCWWVAFRSPNSAGANRAESRCGLPCCRAMCRRISSGGRKNSRNRWPSTAV